MRRALAVIDEYARHQQSLVTRQQLVDAGIALPEIASLLKSGVLRRRGHRVYAALGAPDSWEQKLLGRVLGAGQSALASHGGAARLWNFVHLPERDLDVMIEVNSLTWETRRIRGVHRTLILPSEDVTERSGIPCTNFERTLCDCTTLLSRHQLGRVLDEGLRRHVVSLKELVSCVSRLDSGPGRKLSVIKALLAQRDESFNPGGSNSELDVLHVIRAAQLPLPVQQYRVRVSGHRYDLDYAWPERKLFLEYYGLPVHSGASAVAHDSRRQTALVANGWRPIVFTDETSDSEMVRVLRAVLTSAP